MNKLSLVLADETAQLKLAGDMARHCPTGVVIFLQGNLGTGKTTFVRGFIHALGHHGVVKSPTYTLVEPYMIGGRAVYHFDLYRLADPDELEYAGGRDYFDGESICLIEWPEKAEGYLPTADIECHFDYEKTGRSVFIKANTPKGGRILQLIS